MRKWFAVIGDPIAQSKSPAMHNAWYEEMGVEASYIPLHVTAQNLSKAIDSLKLLGASGFNVTIPHKEAIIPLLDELDDTAQKMGAVNTVVKTADGKYKGYNTDGAGFVRSLEEKVGEQYDKRVLIIGAGGAARGIAFALAQAGYRHITIANRTEEKAKQLIAQLGCGHACSLAEAEQALENYDIFIQTTSAGMTTSDVQLPLSLQSLPAGAIVADIVYNPLMTPFLRIAEEKGAIIVNGLGMFVHQGAIAYNYWLGHYPNTEKTTEQLTKQLQ